MLKINTKSIEEESWASPKGKFGGTCKGVSLALGRKDDVHWKKWTRDSPKWRIEAWEEDAV